MRDRSLIGGALLLGLVAGQARGQELAPRELRIAWASPTAAGSASAPAMTLGGLAGGAIGVVGGFYVGAVLADGDGADDLDFLSGGVAGATIGEGLLLPLGVHLANGRRGSYLASAAASLGIAAAGLLALEAVHYDPPGAPILLIAVPVSQLAAAIAIERATDQPVRP